MGDHPLFHNASTAKRFPDISSVPPDELASLFNVDPVDKEMVAAEELMFHEPHVDPKPNLRVLPPLPPGVPPFKVRAHTEAKRLITAPAQSVFCGYNTISEAVERVRSEKERDRQLRLSDKPFTAGPASQARSRIQNNTYLYSLDRDTVDAVRNVTLKRMKQNRQELLAATYNSASRPVTTEQQRR
jgi:hypothetical protein